MKKYINADFRQLGVLRKDICHSGLTLLELLVVMAIIAVLAGISVPIYSDYKKSSKITTAEFDIKTIETKITLFYIENRKYPDSLDDLGPIPLDPWGRPYQYIPIAGKPLTGPDKVRPRKNRFLHPLNTDYDIYSMGEDGATQLALTAKASHDDIIRADDGKYLGVAKYY